MRALYTLYACVVLVVSAVVMYSGDSRSGLSGTGYRGGSGGGSGYSGGSGHK
jgi:hypothetical protein